MKQKKYIHLCIQGGTQSEHQRRPVFQIRYVISVESLDILDEIVLDAIDGTMMTVEMEMEGARGSETPDVGEVPMDSVGVEDPTADLHQTRCSM